MKEIFAGFLLTSLALLGALLFPPSLPEYGDAGKYFFGGGAYDRTRASFFYEKALEKNPGHEAALHELARLEFLEGDFDEAAQYIDRHIEKHGDRFPSGWYVRGLIYGYRGDTVKGIESFERYLMLRPDHWAAYNDLAWLYFLSGNLSEARLLLEEGLIRAPTNAWLLASYGTVLANMDEESRAKSVYELALTAIDSLTPAEWSRANPGNDPAVALQGIAAMRDVVRRNLTLLESE